MLYNKETQQVKKGTDCLKCKYFDHTLKQCKGIGKNCFLYDYKTKTIIDNITGLPLKKI